MMDGPLLKVVDVAAEVLSRPIHSPLSFDLSSGELGLLVGLNGSGKTSLIRALVGEIPLASGVTHLCGNKVRLGKTWMLTREKVRVIPQFPLLPANLTLAEYIRVWRLLSPRCEARFDADAAIKSATRLVQQDQHVVLDVLSYGQKRILEIFLACLARPLLIFADEPLVGLAQDKIPWCVEALEEFRSQGGGLLVVAHEPEKDVWRADWQSEVKLP